MALYNTDCIQEEFRPACLEVGDACAEYFGERLLAIYLTGSVASGEALPGVSDVDWFMFVTEAPSEEELAWCNALKARIGARYPAAAHFNLTPYPLAQLEQDAFWRFAVRYSCVQLYGGDLLAGLEARGIPVDAPDRARAIARHKWLSPILAELRESRVPSYVYTAPEDPQLAMRKMARYFVICEGAYLLMAEGRFTSFLTYEVFPALREAFPQWEALFAMTGQVLCDPFGVTFTLEEYRGEVVGFGEWMVAYLERLARDESATH